ncbi:MAG: flavin oxidoreductase/NADH oxidase, partial [Firmicutes bacterium]|nr:flavin oxidoreductase/NADH oxidase [Bacillota bacterium]
ELAAGYVQSGICKLVGFGRMAFAYPRFARDILSGEFDKKQSCITCGKCTELMRAGSVTGCVVRDGIYTKLYQEKCAK